MEEEAAQALRASRRQDEREADSDGGDEWCPIRERHLEEKEAQKV